MSDYERQTYAVLGDTFEHVTPILKYEYAPTEDTPISILRASCVTRYPAPRCNCGMFNIEWHLRDE